MKKRTISNLVRPANAALISMYKWTSEFMITMDDLTFWSTHKWGSPYWEEINDEKKQYLKNCFHRLESSMKLMINPYRRFLFCSYLSNICLHYFLLIIFSSDVTVPMRFIRVCKNSLVLLLVWRQILYPFGIIYIQIVKIMVWTFTCELISNFSKH